MLAALIRFLIGVLEGIAGNVATSYKWGFKTKMNDDTTYTINDILEQWVSAHNVSGFECYENDTDTIPVCRCYSGEICKCSNKNPYTMGCTPFIRTDINQ